MMCSMLVFYVVSGRRRFPLIASRPLQVTGGQRDGSFSADNPSENGICLYRCRGLKVSFIKMFCLYTVPYVVS